MSRSPITCHVLDTSQGKPAAGIEVILQKHEERPGDASVFRPFAASETDADGRCSTLLPPRGSEDAKAKNKEVTPGIYKIVFRTKSYFDKLNVKCFYPYVEIVFEIANEDEHYHIPLLISPYSYTTYRGS
ncbi:transthyretin [Coniophora puteana RWD-64-598 SS2]|uniref:5-hydroxyisourate hydrolase n=1 Tax=Coniophora puteana (strain RWD-64-598) TaxID=741705 RepID=A0A5M3N6E0_CONPW|nr:transthyretin [Coniophora puteana RWD-64-598 SS2]EIW87010.1 transthyretin [Coniophora puteana RWD-64-598 SS2]